MGLLVLTIVGADRAGLVAEVADTVAAHGGNWEDSSLSELAGAFAGVVAVSAPDDRIDALTDALGRIAGLTIVTRPGEATAAPARTIELTLIGNDRPGIVREISGVLSDHAVSIDRMSTEVTDAAMYGGRLFEASVSAHLPTSADPGELRAALERIAAEVQVDLTLTD